MRSEPKPLPNVLGGGGGSGVVTDGLFTQEKHRSPFPFHIFFHGGPYVVQQALRIPDGCGLQPVITLGYILFTATLHKGP